MISGKIWNSRKNDQFSTPMMKIWTGMETSLSFLIFHDIQLKRNINVWSKTWTKRWFNLPQHFLSKLHFRGSNYQIGAGPSLPWVPPTASVCGARGRPSTRFPPENSYSLQRPPRESISLPKCHSITVGHEIGPRDVSSVSALLYLT